MSEQKPESAPLSVSRRRVSKRSIALIAAGSAVILAVGVSATAFALAPRPSGEPVAQVEESPEPAPTPTPEPTVEPIDRPTSRFDVDCDDLVPAALAASVLDEAVAPVGDWPITSLIDAANVQQGVFRCSWSVGSAESLRAIRVALLPEAADAFHTDAGGLGSESDAVPDVYGDASRHWCVDLPGSAQCSAEILSGTTWIAVAVAGPGSSADRQADLDAVISHVVARVVDAAVLPFDWTATVSPLTDDFMWESAGEIVAEAFSMPGAHGSGYDEIGSMTMLVWERSGFSMVPFDNGSGQYVHIDTLPGGGWAAAELAARPGSVAVQIPGAEHASLVTLHDREYVCLAARGAAICVASDASSGQALVEQVAAYVSLLPSP